MLVGSYHPVRSERALQEAGDDVSGVMAIVRDSAETGVHRQHHQQELHQRLQQPRPTP